MIKIKKLIKSLRYSWQGINKVYWQEQNFRIHVLAAFVVIILALLLRIQIWEFVILILLIAFIFILEIINTIVERLVDLIKPRLHGYVLDIKDMSAAIVFIGALAATGIGALIFLPHLIKILLNS